VIGLLKEFHDI